MGRAVSQLGVAAATFLLLALSSHGKRILDASHLPTALGGRAWPNVHSRLATEPHDSDVAGALRMAADLRSERPRGVNGRTGGDSMLQSGAVSARSRGGRARFPVGPWAAPLLLSPHSFQMASLVNKPMVAMPWYRHPSGAATHAMPDANPAIGLAHRDQQRRGSSRLHASAWIDPQPANLWPETWVEKLQDLRFWSFGGRGTTQLWKANVKENDAADRATEVVVQEFAGWPGDKQAAGREIEIAKAIGGGDVVTLFDAASFKNPGDIGGELLMFEGVCGTLASVVKRDFYQVPLSQILSLQVEMLRGAHKISQAGYVHRNLSPKTIMIKGDCKTSDGCHAKITGLEHIVKPGENQIQAGVLPEMHCYAAPEVFTAQASEASDVWSLGVIFYEMMVGDIPIEFYTDQTASLLGLQAYDHPGLYGFSIERDADFQAMQRYSPDIAEVIGGMMKSLPENRPKIEQTLRRMEEIAAKAGVVVPEQPAVHPPRSWFERT